MATTISSNGSGPGYAALAAAATKAVAGESGKRPYYGKCQYKTGKCFNERTLKRNGDAHSLCEEHRIKQNLIQRRSDRKYQTVHAIRRRERSQRRAVLKKQVSMAVAQQLFFEHQQQKSLGGLPLHLLANGLSAAHPASQGGTPVVAGQVANPAALATPIQIPPSSMSSLPFVGAATGASHASPTPAFIQFPMAQADASAPFIKLPLQGQPQQRAEALGCKSGDEASPTGIDDFATDTFLNISTDSTPAGSTRQCGTADVSLSDESDETLDFGEDFAPLSSCRSDLELWTDEDIEFLQTLLLP